MRGRDRGREGGRERGREGGKGGREGGRERGREAGRECVTLEQSPNVMFTNRQLPVDPWGAELFSELSTQVRMLVSLHRLFPWQPSHR